MLLEIFWAQAQTWMQGWASTAMELLGLKQERFRNLKIQTFKPKPGLNALVGGNAQGKSNLLEAIFVALGGELTASTQEQIAWGASEARLYAEIRTLLGIFRLETRLIPKGREYWLNEAPARRRNFLELPGAVLAGPEDLELIFGGPEARRRFLDQLLSRFSSRYSALLAAYQKALLQRNAALRQGLTVDPWDRTLSRHGEAILTFRRRLVRRLAPLANELHVRLAGYPLELRLLESSPPERLAEELRVHLEEDRQRGFTSVGPHRDDLKIQLKESPAQRYASRGEARSIALALRLAEAQLLSEHFEDPPLLLIDEWNSELDPKRQRALYELAQSFPQALFAGLNPPPDVPCWILEEGSWKDSSEPWS